MLFTELAYMYRYTYAKLCGYEDEIRRCNNR